MLDRLYLFVLRKRLKRYKRDARWYEKRGLYNNWYHEWGIPHLEKEIRELEDKINNSVIPRKDL